jgi:hypothetical protein
MKKGKFVVRAWPAVPRLYAGVVADILDSRIRLIPAPAIRPMKDHMKVAGPAFTCLGVQTGDVKAMIPQC